MIKKSINDESDISFDDWMKSVKRITSNKILLHKKSRLPVKLPEQVSLKSTHSAKSQAPTVHPEQMLFFTRPHLSAKTLNRLRQGKLPIKAKLDLHGLTWAQAENELINFFHQRQLTQQHLVLIIPGKGQVLKTQLNHWLQSNRNVLAFASAKPQHGGTGAVYVLVRADGKS